MKKLILAFISIFFLGLLIGYIPTLAFPGPGKPNPGHTASEIGGDTDAERTFNSTGKYTFLGNLDVRGGLTVSGTVSASTFKTRNQACPSGWTCEVNTWDIAAQSAKLYGGLDVSQSAVISGNLNVGGKLNVGGSIKFYGGWSESCNSDNLGTLRYYVACVFNSEWTKLQLCTKTNETKYEWVDVYKTGPYSVSYTCI